MFRARSVGVRCALSVLGGLVALGVGCLPPPPPLATSAGPATTPGGVAPRVERRIVVVATRPSGRFTTTTSANGEIRVQHEVVQNGRGPSVDAQLNLAADWTIAAFTAVGHHTMGTKLAERFERKGDRARWKSVEEQGDQEIDGPAFFIPIADMPISWLLVPAALKAGGKIALLPAGEATVTQVAELDVAAAGNHKRLIGYAIDGLGLQREYAWFEASGVWFGNVSSFTSVVPEGWEAAIEPLVKRQDELDRVRDAELATRNATRPVTGVAFTEARVLDVDKGTWTPNQTVLVIGGVIKAVGPAARVKIPEGVDTISVGGQGVMPGLIDMHTHLTTADAVLSLASGVTTVRDVGSDPDQLDDFKRRFDDGTAIGPHVVRMGFIEGRNEKAAASKITAETVDEARAAVAFYADRGYAGIKIYNSVRSELVPLLAADAHVRGMLVTGHVPVHMLASEVVQAGFDGIEHINMLFLNFFATKDTDTRDTTRFTLVGDRAADLALDSKPVLAFLDLLRQRKTVIDPTLSAFQDLFVGIPGKITPGLEPVVARLPPQTARWFVTGGLPMDGETQQRYRRAWTQLLAMVKAVWRARIPLVLGTDHIGGVMLHHEMALFVEAGIPTKDVVRMATIGAARAMRIDKQVGSIAVGMRADLVVVNGDPIANIADIRKTAFTMRGGVLYQTDALYKIVGVKP